MSLMDSAVKKPTETPGEQKAEKPVTGEPEGAVPGEVKSAAKPATAAAPTEELKFVPEQHRKFFEAAPPEVVKWVKDRNDGWMKDADYRQKTEAVAISKREFEAEMAEKRTLYQFAEQVASDAGAMEALRAYHANRNGKPSAATKFDPADATPESYQAHIEALRKEIRDEIMGEIRGERESESKEKAEKREMALAAKAEFVDSGEYEAKEIDDLYDRLVGDGVKFSKDNIIEKLRRYAPKREPKAVKAEEPAKSIQGDGAAEGKTSAAASVLSRAAGASPMTAPAFVREHRAPKTVDERIQEAQWVVAQRKARAGIRTS